MHKRAGWQLHPKMGSFLACFRTGLAPPWRPGHLEKPLPRWPRVVKGLHLKSRVQV